MLNAALVPPADVGAWNDLARRRGEFFQDPAWVDLLDQHAARVGVYGADGVLVGGFVVSSARVAGFPIQRNPLFCQNAGPFWEERATSNVGRLEERRRTVDAMARYLDPGRGVTLVGLSPSVVDVLPFRWHGFKCIVDYTYRLPLQGRSDEDLAGYDERIRRSIRRAKKDLLEARVGLDLEGISQLQEEALARDAAKGAHALPAVRRYASVSPGCFTVMVYSGPDVLAGCLVVGSKQTAYYLMGGHRRRNGKGAHHGAGPLALHSAIAESARRGFETFDFEGSTIPRVEEFVRGFGGTLTPYYRVAKAWFPLECALKLRYRKYF